MKTGYALDAMEQSTVKYDIVGETPDCYICERSIIHYNISGKPYRAVMPGPRRRIPKDKIHIKEE